MLVELTTYGIFWSSIVPCWQCGLIQKQCNYRLRLSHLIIFCTGNAIIAHRIITRFNDINLIDVSSKNENQDFYYFRMVPDSSLPHDMLYLLLAVRISHRRHIL